MPNSKGKFAAKRRTRSRSRSGSSSASGSDSRSRSNSASSRSSSSRSTSRSRSRSRSHSRSDSDSASSRSPSPPKNDATAKKVVTQKQENEPIKEVKTVQKENVNVDKQKPMGATGAEKQPDRAVKVEPKQDITDKSDKKRDRRSASVEPPRTTRVYISRLTRNVHRKHLEEIFRNYGTVKSIDMPTDRMHPEHSRGFAYIEFERSEEALAAVKFLDGGQIDGQEVSVTAVLEPKIDDRLAMDRAGGRGRDVSRDRDRDRERDRVGPARKRSRSRSRSSPRRQRFGERRY